MGGSRAEIGPGTRRVLLEAAWFLPMAVARTGSRLGLHSEARVRFERGVDPEIAGAAVDRFVALLSTVPAGTPGRGRSRGPGAGSGPGPGRPLPFGAARPWTSAARRCPRRFRCRSAPPGSTPSLGTSLDDATVAGLLEPIGFSVRPRAPGVATVGIPSWRLDCEREIDVIEEVARTWGYGRIERTIPPGAPGGSGGLTDRQRQVRQLRDILAGAGYDEAWTTTFLAPGDLERAGLDPAAVEVENPLDRSESILRTELLPGLLKAVKFNVDRQAEDVALFEIGHVFALPQPPEVTPDETERLAVIVAPAAGADGAMDGTAADRRRRPPPRCRPGGTWPTPSACDEPTMVAARVPGLHPTRAARSPARTGAPWAPSARWTRTWPRPTACARASAISPCRWMPSWPQPRRPWQAQEVSRFPASDIDLAFVVPDAVPAAAVQRTLATAAGSGCSNGSGFSTCTAATSSGPAGAAWPSACASGLRIALSMKPPWRRCASRRSMPSLVAHGATPAVMTTPLRRLELERAWNFRDLGGYQARDGRLVRWRRLFRADGLDRLTEADLRQIELLGLRTVDRPADRPTRWPSGRLAPTAGDPGLAPPADARRPAAPGGVRSLGPGVLCGRTVPGHDRLAGRLRRRLLDAGRATRTPTRWCFIALPARTAPGS